MSRALVIFAMLAASTAAPAIGVAPGSVAQPGQARFEIRGFVPVICKTQLSTNFASVTDGVQDLGNLREFCNSPRGYDVYADFSKELTHAKLLVDGKPVPLGSQGTVIVSRSNRAAIDARDIQLDLGKKAAPGTISFRIEPR